MMRTVVISAACGVMCAASPLAISQCPPQVESGFGLPGASWDVSGIALHDSPAMGGRRVVIGGSFGAVGGAEASTMATWDGTTWNPFTPPSGTGSVSNILGNADPNSSPLAPLVMSRSFQTYVWSNSSWSQITRPNCGNAAGPYAAAHHPGAAEPTIYSPTGCAFGSFGGGLAQVVGTAWAPLASPMLTGSTVSTLVPFDAGDGEKLYVTGNLNPPTLGALSAARYDGVSWSTLPAGWPANISGFSVAFEGANRVLYAVTTTGAPATVGVWQLRAGVWSALTGGLPIAGISNQITLYDDGSGPKPHAIVWRTNIDGSSQPEVDRWTDTGWELAARPTIKQPGRSLSMTSLRGVQGLPGNTSALLVGGNFRGFDWGIAHNIAMRRNHAGWQSVWSPAHGILGLTRGCETIPDPVTGGESLLLVGDFTVAGTTQVQNAAVWNGEAWGPMPGFEVTEARATGSWVHDGQRETLVWGEVRNPSGSTSDAVIRYRGNTASLLPGVVYAFQSAGIRAGTLEGKPAMFMGGDISIEQDGQLFGTVVAWDGERWHPLHTGPNAPNYFSFYRLASAVDLPGDSTSTLVMLGSPNSSAPNPKPYIAQRRNGTWTTFGALTGSAPAVNGIAWFDDGSGNGPEMYAAGAFDTIDGVPARNVAKRVGTAWVPVGSVFTAGGAWGIRNVPDDDGTPTLLIWGNLIQNAATRMGYFARLNGAKWVPAGPDARVSPGGIEITDVVPLPSAGGGPARFAVLGSVFGLGYGASVGLAFFHGLGDRPLIESVPTDLIRRATGQSITLSAQVAGSVTSMRWHRAGVPLIDDARIAGASTPTLSIAGLTASDQGAYTLVAVGGCGSSESIPVQVRVCVDIVVDGIVNTRDLTRFLVLFGETVIPGSQGDLDADGDVDTADLTRFLGAFGRTCATN